MVRIAAVMGVFVAVLILDPVGAWSSESFDYGAKEMNAAIEGTWELTLDGETTRFEISQAAKVARAESGGLVKAAVACNKRTLVRSAGACAGGDTTMPLDIRVTNGLLKMRSGKFFVSGLQFKEGALEIAMGSFTLTATVSPKGKVSKLVPPAWAEGKPAKLVRLVFD